MLRFIYNRRLTGMAGFAVPTDKMYATARTEQAGLHPTSNAPRKKK